MTKKSADHQQITKKDLDKLAKTIVKGVTELIDTQTIQIGRLEGKVDSIEASNNRIENKLDATVDHVDDHEVRIKRLEKRPA